MTIPYGWNLIIDESPPALNALTIFGNVSFSSSVNVTLTATYIVVANRGRLSAGSAASPHPSSALATILLNGNKTTPQWPIDETLNLGSKVLAAVRGGTIDLHGTALSKRWTKLGAAAAAGDISVTVAEAGLGWKVGDSVLIGSTSFNTWQAEMRTIAAVGNNGALLTLNETLRFPHGGLVKAYPGGPTVDMRAEIAIISSNVVVTASNGAAAKAAGDLFGARIVVSGNSTGRFSNALVQYCGQAGLTARSCILYDRLTPVTPQAGGSAVANPSFLSTSAVVYGLHSNLRLQGATAISVTGNVMYESYDVDGVDVVTK